MTDKKKNNKSVGYLFIIIGILMIVPLIIKGSESWETFDFIKLSLLILLSVMGIYFVVRT